MYLEESLELLIEEKKDIKGKITKAMQDLKEWFLNKIEHVKDFFIDLKRKISESINKKIPGNARLDRDISIEGEIVFPKGTPMSKVNSGIIRQLGEVNRQKDIVIRECKNGVIDISRRDSEAAIDKKKKVVKAIKIMTKSASLIMAGLKIHRKIKTVKQVKNMMSMMDDMPRIEKN